MWTQRCARKVVRSDERHLLPRWPCPDGLQEAVQSCDDPYMVSGNNQMRTDELVGGNERDLLLCRQRTNGLRRLAAAGAGPAHERRHGAAHLVGSDQPLPRRRLPAACVGTGDALCSGLPAGTRLHD